MSGLTKVGSVHVQSFYHSQTATFTYLVHSGIGTACAVIDSVLTYDADSGHLDSQPADDVLMAIEKQRLSLEWILETHIHADHLTAAAYLRDHAGGRIAAGIGVQAIQQVFQQRLCLPDRYCQALGHFDHFFAPGERFAIGQLLSEAMSVPGHTPADLAYVVNQQTVFVGDTLFLPDVGTARCDFPGGNAQQLYYSIQRLLSLPASTRLFMCHDYPQGRAPNPSCTVSDQQKLNRHLHKDLNEFVAWREARDRVLPAPKLMHPAILWNLRAGVKPDAATNNVEYEWRS